MSTDLNDLRQRVLAGQELTLAEYRAVLDAKRDKRQAAAEAAVQKKSKAKKGPSKVMSLEEMDALLNKI